MWIFKSGFSPHSTSFLLQTSYYRHIKPSLGQRFCTKMKPLLSTAAWTGLCRLDLQLIRSPSTVSAAHQLAKSVPNFHLLRLNASSSSTKRNCSRNRWETLSEVVPQIVLLKQLPTALDSQPFYVFFAVCGKNFTTTILIHILRCYKLIQQLEQN